MKKVAPCFLAVFLLLFSSFLLLSCGRDERATEAMAGNVPSVSGTETSKYPETDVLQTEQFSQQNSEPSKLSKSSTVASSITAAAQMTGIQPTTKPESPVTAATNPD